MEIHVKSSTNFVVSFALARKKTKSNRKSKQTFNTQNEMFLLWALKQALGVRSWLLPFCSLDWPEEVAGFVWLVWFGCHEI